MQFSIELLLDPLRIYRVSIIDINREVKRFQFHIVSLDTFLRKKDLFFKKKRETKQKKHLSNTRILSLMKSSTL